MNLLTQLKTLLLGVFLTTFLTFSGSPLLFPSVTVEAARMQDVALNNSLPFEDAFQKALDVARDSRNKNITYRIKVPAGTYKAGSCFNVYSNTYIDLTGVTLIRTSNNSMIRFGRGDDVKNISGYSGFKISQSMVEKLTDRVLSVVTHPLFCALLMRAM